MIDVFTKSIIYLLIIIVGYVLKRLHFFSPTDFTLIARIVCNITIPCAIITSFADFDFELSLLWFIFIGVLSNLLLIFLGFLISLRKESEHKAFFMLNMSGFNFGSFSLPYIQSFFSSTAVVAACLVDMGNSFFCTGGSYAIAAAVMDKREKGRMKTFIKRIFSSLPVDVYLVMTLLSILGISPPTFVLTFADTVGSANAFLAMLMIGMSLSLQIKKRRVWDITKILFVRFASMGVLALLLWLLLPLESELKMAIVLVLLSPLTSLNPAYTEQLAGDTALSGQVTSLSILISAVLMTVIIPFI